MYTAPPLEEAEHDVKDNEERVILYSSDERDIEITPPLPDEHLQFVNVIPEIVRV